MSKFVGVDANLINKEELQKKLEGHIRTFQTIIDGAKEGKRDVKVMLSMLGNVFNIFIYNADKYSELNKNEEMDVQKIFIKSCLEYATLGMHALIEMEMKEDN